MLLLVMAAVVVPPLLSTFSNGRYSFEAGTAQHSIA